MDTTGLDCSTRMFPDASWGQLTCPRRLQEATEPTGIRMLSAASDHDEDIDTPISSAALGS